MDPTQEPPSSQPALEREILIHLVLGDERPLTGHADLGGPPGGPPGTQAEPDDPAASVDFSGWLGLMAAVGRLVELATEPPSPDEPAQ